jgi:hypothetical protein
MLPKLGRLGTAEVGLCKVPVDPNECPDAPAVFNSQLKASGGLHFGAQATDVQTSCRVRPHSMTMCNGQYFEPGVLRAVDLNRYRENVAGYPGAETVLDWFYLDSDTFRPRIPRAELIHTDTILYRIHHMSGGPGKRQRVDLGWILTGADGWHLKRLDIDGKLQKRKMVVMEFAQSIFTRTYENYKPLVRVIHGKIVELDESLRGHPAIQTC